MGVFEQQHCNYEHLFGQALSPDFMCTGQSPIWKGRNTPPESARPRRDYQATVGLERNLQLTEHGT